MNRISEIEPGIGIGPFRFGMTETEAMKALGPDFVRDDFEDGDFHLSDKLRSIGLCFEPAEYHGLQTIEVDSRYPCRLFGQAAFPNTKDGVIRLLFGRLGHNIKFKEQRENIDNHIYVDCLGMFFYFDEEDNLEEILWGIVEKDEGGVES